MQESYKIKKEDEAYVVNYYGNKESETELIWQVTVETQLFEYEMNDDGQTITITGIKKKYSSGSSSEYPPIVDGDGNKITTLVIPSHIDGYPVTVIGSNECACKSGLLSVIISEGIVKICSRAFYNMPNEGLSIYIPSSITTIEEPIAPEESSGYVFNCAANSKPAGWADNWFNNGGGLNHVVNWGVKGVSH